MNQELIKTVFNKVGRDIAFTYIIKKVAETAKKADRINTVNNLIEYLETSSTKGDAEIIIHNRFCNQCKDPVDQDTGLCLNCGAKN